MRPSNLMRQIASEENLWSAWDEVYLARGAPGVDGVTVRNFNVNAGEALSQLARQLLARRYRPRALRRVWVPKRGKEDQYRALSIPIVRDRIAARGAAQVLRHVFESGFHESSFGYRPARGTFGAIRRVTRLRDAGARWVARADIHEFFQSIDQRLLFARLEPVLPADIRRILLLWTRTWIHEGEDRWRAKRGVPQGTATSPLLANFYLNPYDEHVEFEGFQGTRYVDDLVVTARTSTAAWAGLRIITAGLEPLGLQVNAQTARIASFAAGFEFLGFEFQGNTIRIAASKLDEFRCHARMLLDHPRAGSMRRRVGLLNRMIRGWRAYYRTGIPREQFEELDAWLEKQVRAATLRRWARQRPEPQDLELAGLESLRSPGRRIFQPPAPPSLEGYQYTVRLEGVEDASGVVTIGATDSLEYEDGHCTVLDPSRARKLVRHGTRVLVIADGARLHARALRALLERGIALRFVAGLTLPGDGVQPQPNPESPQ